MGGTQEYLYHLVRLTEPETVVETGVFRGISSAFLLAGLAANGHGKLSSVDLPHARYSIPGRKQDYSPLPKGEPTGFVVPEVLRDRWTLISGNSRSELAPLLDRLVTVDLFFHDSEHSYEFMRWEYALAVAHISNGGVLASDDVDWNPAFSEFVQSPSVKWATTIHDKLGIAIIERHPVPQGDSGHAQPLASLSKSG